jgi:LPS-assembly protein
MNKLLIVIIFLLFSSNVFSQENAINQLPARLTANKIESDNKRKKISAKGNAKFTKGGNSIFADKIEYFQTEKKITAIGDVKLDNYQMGNMSATKAEFKDNFASGKVENPALIFFDGSYIKAKDANKKKNITFLKKSIFSVCPNDQNSNKYQITKQKEPFSISSSIVELNNDQETIKLKNPVVRIYDVPVFYSPYFKALFPASKRKSGFLSPSYSKAQNLGLGITLPYYVNIDNNKDLTVRTSYFPDTKHVLVNNEFRHLIKYGAYDINLELANNNLEQESRALTVNNKIEDRDLRGQLSAQGKFILSKFSDLNLNINHVGDKEYLRDYKSDFTDHTVSDIAFINHKIRRYFSAKAVNIQELSVNEDRKTSPLALPILESYIESKPKYFNTKYSLLSNLTTIHRREGLQYRRLSFVPEIKLPYNAYGNLFEAKLNMQGNFYHIDDAYKYTNISDSDYKKREINHYPRASIGWKMPIARQGKKNMIIFEPMAKFVASPRRDKSNNLYNEDVNDNELTQANLFLDDRLIGFDRNETGQRVSYGFNSYLFNNLGEFDLNLGQSQKFNNATQDVTIRGFNDNNKSNIVGKISYKNDNNLSLIYNFHLSESDYNNEVNDFSYFVPISRLNFSGNYLLLKSSNSNDDVREQWNSNAGIDITSRLNVNAGFSKDLVAGKIINKNYSLMYNGCCVSYGLTISEENLGDFTKKQRSYSFNLVIKNL